MFYEKNEVDFIRYLIKKYLIASHNIDKEIRIRESNFYLRCTNLKFKHIGEIYTLKESMNFFNEIENQRKQIDFYSKNVSEKMTYNPIYNYNLLDYSGNINKGTYPNYNIDSYKNYYKTYELESICSHCGATQTSLWRKLEGNIVCNACGLYFKMHNRIRPQSLKKDYVRKRNRSRRY